MWPAHTDTLKYKLFSYSAFFCFQNGRLQLSCVVEAECNSTSGLNRHAHSVLFKVEHGYSPIDTGFVRFIPISMFEEKTISWPVFVLVFFIPKHNRNTRILKCGSQSVTTYNREIIMLVLSGGQTMSRRHFLHDLKHILNISYD